MSYYNQEQERISDLEKSNAALLEALEGMAMLWKVTCGLKGWEEDAQQNILKAKAAIAAARGE